ncbi:aminotransferase class I and II [Plectosphaerella plurivora]|uniref:Aminotransferase class I and II n=1 Tax=Plectosphaerella plurivora TaxID=936078 RepID=A0A9P8V146_9PEZI|nr:aminotransferase class I and II [Plectosphaerella plurivora]
MVRIAPFDVEQWMDEYEVTPGCLNIAETCAASVSLDELIQLSEDKTLRNPISLTTKLVYGAIRGSDALRRNVANLYKQDDRAADLTPENVLITQGAIGANFLSLYSLVSPGDHVVCVYPTYQQLYGVPESLGAEVSLWRLKKDNGFIPDVAELETLVKPNTKMIILNNPNNPTGAAIPTAVLGDIIAFAKARNITVFSDEVYRPLFHNLHDKDAVVPAPITSFGYDNVVVTGSMSKAYALAGIRVGWVVSPNKEIIARLASARDYTTISVSQLDDAVAAYALSPPVRDPLLRRNVSLAKTNVALLEAFVQKNSAVCSWVKPVAGTTAFVHFTNNGQPVDDATFCLDVLNETKVFIVPGSKCFGGSEDFAGYVRVGYVCHTDVLVEALEKLSGYVQTHLS